MLYLKKPEILNLPIERRETYKTNSNLAEVAVSKALCHYHHHSLRNIRRRCRLLVLFKINTRFCRNWILAYLFVICRNLWWDDSWLESGDWGRWWIDDSIYCLKAEAFFFVKKKRKNSSLNLPLYTAYATWSKEKLWKASKIHRQGYFRSWTLLLGKFYQIVSFYLMLILRLKIWVPVKFGDNNK